MNKLSFLIPLILTSLLVNFYVYKSYVAQGPILTDFNQSQVLEKTFNDYVKDNNFNFPNITSTALPFLAIKANYYYRFGDLDKALQILNIKRSDNPHWHIKEFLKASIYNDLGIIDSSLYYSRQAFKGLPNNIAHFELYSINLARSKNIDELNSAFSLIDIDNPILMQIYLGILLNISEDFDELTLKNVKEIRKIHYNNDEIFGMSSQVLYGKANITLSSQFSSDADRYYLEKDYDNALINYRKAISLFPGDPSYFENAALIAYHASQNQEALDLIQISIDSFPSRKDGKANYIKALALINLNRIDEACKSLSISRKLNFNQSFKLFNKTCF